jgi:hypothetical protein
MPFMRPHTGYFACYHVETTHGTEIIPSDLAPRDIGALRRYLEGEPYDADDEPAEMQEGYYARLSAPGYMDATDWVGPYESEDAALDALAEAHGVCRGCWDDCYHDDESLCGWEDEG